MNSSWVHLLHFILINQGALKMKLVTVYFLSLLVLVGCGLVKFQPIPDPHNDDSHNHDINSTNNPTNNPTSNPPVVAPNNLVTYTIVNGQGLAPWGSLSNPIRGVVGQKLRIINNDGQPHAIHTDGNPFNHTDDIAPGTTMDFTLLRPITTSASNPSTYKHTSTFDISPIYFAITPAVAP